MEAVGATTLWSFPTDAEEAVRTTNEEVRLAPGHRVRSYLDLAKRIAEVQFRNPSLLLLFRGQSADHRDEANLTSLKPSILRSRNGALAALTADTLQRRFSLLRTAEETLATRYRDEVDRLGNTLVNRFRIVRWAILQHYEVCRTPLLDTTHSLRIASSFAALQQGAPEAYLLVLGVPGLSGAITVNAEAGLQIVRLASVCPPSALRPHLQEAYLLGEYPDLNAFQQKLLYPVAETDFGLRLVAKFRFDPNNFWRPQDFPAVARPALYPQPHHDPIFQLTDSIRRQVRPHSRPST